MMGGEESMSLPLNALAHALLNGPTDGQESEYGARGTGLDPVRPLAPAEKVRNPWKRGIDGTKKFTLQIRNDLPQERLLLGVGRFLTAG